MAIGAIAGNKAGKGAAIGAVVGTVAGGVHQQQKDEAAQAQTYADQQQAQQALASYDRAYAACLEGRGYTVSQISEAVKKSRANSQTRPPLP